jgi:hypothetical protein
VFGIGLPSKSLPPDPWNGRLAFGVGLVVASILHDGARVTLAKLARLGSQLCQQALRLLRRALSRRPPSIGSLDS